VIAPPIKPPTAATTPAKTLHYSENKGQLRLFRQQLSIFPYLTYVSLNKEMLQVSIKAKIRYRKKRRGAVSEI
jgi:hypothetical protein